MKMIIATDALGSEKGEQIASPVDRPERSIGEGLQDALLNYKLPQSFVIFTVQNYRTHRRHA